MNKAFVKEDAPEEEDAQPAAPALPHGAKNYMTRRGHDLLKAELAQLVKSERPALVQTVAWAAANGDRSENGDYIYGKKRLREIDRRIRFLSKRLEHSEVIDPAQRGDCDQVFFGATVTVSNSAGEEKTYSIVGLDEVDVGRGRISWISPLAKTLLKAREGDVVTLRTPGGVEELDVVEIRYVALEN